MASAQSTFTGKVGANTQYVYQSEASAQAGLTALAKDGVNWTREPIPWENIEPANGVWNWSYTDNLMTAAASSKTGIQILGLLAYSAPWASSDPNPGDGCSGSNPASQCIFYPPSNFSQYASFAQAVTARYGPGGSFWTANPSLTPDPIAALEVWNEAWGYWDWLSGPNPGQYANLVIDAAKSIHSADQSMPVLMDSNVSCVTSPHGNCVGSTQAQGTSWLTAVLQDMQTDGYNPSTLVAGLSSHPYPDPNSQGPTDISSSQQFEYAAISLQQQEEGGPGLGYAIPIWITEVGWYTCDSNAGYQGFPCDQYGVSSAIQADYMTQAVQIGLTSWSSYVPHVFMYSYGSGDLSPANYDIKGQLAESCVAGLISQGTIPPQCQTVTFDESGLQSTQSQQQLPWCVYFNGSKECATFDNDNQPGAGSSITFALGGLQNGTYPYTITSPAGFSTNKASGTVGVTGGADSVVDVPYVPVTASANYVAAVKVASSGSLWTVGSNGQTTNWSLGVAAGTSPSIARLSDGSWEAAFQEASANHLYLLSSSGVSHDTGQVMATHTSPSITAMAAGGWVVGYQKNDAYLWTLDSSGVAKDSYRGMENNTSPSMAGLPGGGWEAAISQCCKSDLVTVGSNGAWKDSGQVMASGTSPSITAMAAGGWVVGYQKNDAYLWTLDSSGVAKDSYRGMENNTSPSMAGLPGGGWEAAISQCCKSDLVTVGSNGAWNDTGQVMTTGTSPSIMATSGGYEIAFVASSGDLWTIGSGGGSDRRNWFLQADPSTSPAIAP